MVFQKRFVPLFRASRDQPEEKDERPDFRFEFGRLQNQSRLQRPRGRGARAQMGHQGII